MSGRGPAGWRRWRRPTAYVLRASVILGVCAVVLFPVYWMVLSAIQPSSISLSYPPPMLPRAFHWSAFTDLFEQQPVARWLLLSTLVAGAAALGTLVLVIPGAYAMSALRWRGRGVVGLILLFTQMMPAAMIAAPVLGLYRGLGWTNSLVTLAVLHTALVVPLCAWILKSSFDAVPRELTEAALLDGSSRWGVLWRLLVPLARPGLVAVSVVAFFASWNEYLFASLLITDRDLFTASLGIATLITQLDTPLFVLMAAGVTFSILPVAFYVTIQRHMLRGLTAGAVKG